MNLIGHFACAAPHGPALQLGAVLPDLLGLHRRRPRVDAIARLWADGPAPPEGVAGVLAGIRFHHFVDVRFHHAPLFRDVARDLRVAMAGVSDTPGLKRFFAAHVLIELYYDHLLLHRTPATADAFYAVLDGAHGALLHTFALRHPEVEREPLKAFMDQILAHRFVEDYLTLDGLFYRLERMLLRHRQRALEDQERRAAADYLEERADALRRGLLLFVESMQQWDGAAAAGGLPAEGRTGPRDARLPG